jgi:hypothetical protein
MVPAGCTKDLGENGLREWVFVPGGYGRGHAVSFNAVRTIYMSGHPRRTFSSGCGICHAESSGARPEAART